MHDSLTKHAAQLARLAMMIRIGLESAEAAIPGINDLLAELATLGLRSRAVVRSREAPNTCSTGRLMVIPSISARGVRGIFFLTCCRDGPVDCSDSAATHQPWRDHP